MEAHTASLLEGLVAERKDKQAACTGCTLHRPACLNSFSWCNVGMLAYPTHGPLCICLPYQGQDICPRLCFDLHCMCLQLYFCLHKALYLRCDAHHALDIKWLRREVRCNDRGVPVCSKLHVAKCYI